MNEAEVQQQIKQVRAARARAAPAVAPPPASLPLPLPRPAPRLPRSAPPGSDDARRRAFSQMVQFIHQEAKEKAMEIKLKADEEFNIEKLRMVEGEKQKIRAEYERKEKNVEVQKRIAQSNEVRAGQLDPPRRL